MSQSSPSWRTVVVYQLMQVPFLVLLAIGWPTLLGLEPGAVLTIALVADASSLFLSGWHLRVLLRPADAWRHAGADRPQRLLEADVALQRTPSRFTLVLAANVLGVYLLATIWVWFAMLEVAPIGPAELASIAFFLVALFTGAGAFTFSVLNMLILSERVAVSEAMTELGLRSKAGHSSLRTRLSALILAFILAPTALFAAAGQSTATALERHRVVAELNDSVAEDLTRLEAGLEPRAGELVDADALPPASEARTKDDLPLLRHRVTIDRRQQRASVAAPVDRERWLLVEGSLDESRGSHSAMLLAFFVVLAMFALANSILVPRSLIEPLQVLEAKVRRLVTIGDVRQLDPIPVIQNDELGTLTQCFNDLIENFRTLADAALAVSRGDLAVEIERDGDLQDAFRGMVARLREMVIRILETASDVGGAAAEIYATAQVQETAATEHSSSVKGVSARIASLAESATDITTRATGVLENAEQTSERADAMVAKIGELSAQANGIADLLEIIREVADRSDLLALNGSLEATRAGEAGRGFALVATEMRRLAERVTEAVTDVRGRVTDIKDSGANTVLATEHSRKLAEDTATAAREIFTLTRAQSDDTTHVSEVMQTMSEFVVTASVSTSQTRAAAESLRQQVDELERMTRQFKLESRSDPADPTLAR